MIELNTNKQINNKTEKEVGKANIETRSNDITTEIKGEKLPTAVK